MNKITLFTRQHENSIYELNEKGVITNKEIYVKLHMGDIFEFFDDKYKKFVEMAEKIVTKPEKVEYPLWCSVSKNNCLKPTAGEIVYCLEVPEDEIIYFDGGKWDFVLNNLYIPLDDNDKAEYDKKIESLNVTDEYSFIDGKYKGMYPDIEKKIVESWDRIFIIDNWNEFIVQANLWHIKKEWVKHIIKPGEDFFEITKDMENTFPPKGKE